LQLEFKEESHLQQLLHESPDLIVTKEEELPAIFMRGAGLPGSGSTDLVGVDGFGNILVVETKLAKSHEIRRKVIGQVLEYAAYLWRMPYEEFNSLFKRREGRTIEELFREQSDSISIEEIIGKVETNLESGRFKLLIAVDRINPELEKTIAYLSSFRTGVQLEALEVKIYQDREVEVFVPHRHGSMVAEPEPITGGRTTVEDIIAGAPNDQCRIIYQILVAEWERLGHVVHPGSAGASFKAEIHGRLEPIFWAFGDHINALMSVLQSRGVPAKVLTNYRSKVAQLPGVNGKRLMSDARPRIELTKISDDGARSFVFESDNLVKDWSKDLTVEP